MSDTSFEASGYVSLAVTECKHGVSVNLECDDCELDALIEGEQDSILTADEDWGRWPR